MVEINRRHAVLTSVLHKCVIIHAHAHTFTHRVQVFMGKVYTPATSIEAKTDLKLTYKSTGHSRRQCVQVSEANLS